MLKLVKKTDYPGYPVVLPTWSNVFSCTVANFDGVIVRLTPQFFVDRNGQNKTTRIAVARFRIFLEEDNAAPWLLEGGTLGPAHEVLRLSYDVEGAQTLRIQAATSDPATTGVARPVLLQAAVFGVSL